MEWFSKKKEETEKKIKVDSGYDIFSENNVGNIATSLSNMSALIGDYKEPDYFFNKESDNKKSWNGYEYYTLNNENTLNFIGANEGKFGSEFKTYFSNLAEYSKINGIKASKGLAALGKKAEDITNSVMNAFTRKEEATFTSASKNNDIVNGSNELFKPDNGKYFTEVEKTVQQNIINQNLSAFKGEEKAPKTVKINGTEFSPQEIAEVMGGGKSLNEFIGEKDKLFKQSGKDDKDKSEDEKNADVIRGRLSEGLALLGEYSGNLDINKLPDLLETCKKDFEYFDKNNETNFFKDLENLRELEQKIQQEKERQEKERQEKERQEKERQEKERQEKERQEKERQERQEINKNINDLKQEAEDAVNREKQRQQQLLNQAKVNTCNKLYNGVEGKETNPVKSFDGKNFYKDETNTEQTEIKDAKLGLENEKLNQYNNKVKNFAIQLEGNVKNSENLESLEKNKKSIDIMGELSNNARQLNEEEDKIEGEYNKVQESLDYIKKKVQKNLLLLDEYSQNTSKEFNITQEEIEKDIEGKTIEDIEKELEEFKKEREEIINDFIKDCEKVAKEIDTNKKENDEKIAGIRNDINNINDSDINSFNEETKKKTEELKRKNFFKVIENKKIKNFEDYGLEDIDRDIARLEKQKELVQERNKAVAPKEPTPKSPTVESEAAKAAKILNGNKFGRFASNGESFTENDMMPENFEKSIRPILEEFNENFKEYENKGLNKDNQEYEMYRNSVRMFDKNVKEEDIRVYFNINNVNSYDKENKDTKNLGEYDISYQNYIKNKNQENENDKNHASTINKIKIGSSFETSDKNDIGIITTFSDYGARTDPVLSVNGIVDLRGYMEKEQIRQKEEENKKDTIDRDIPTQPEPIKSEQSTALDDELNKAKVDARNDLSKIPNPNAEMANNFHDGKFYKDKKELSMDKSNVGINNTDNAIDCIIEQNEENIVKSKNKKEVEEAKKNNIKIREFYNKTVELKEEKNKFDKRHTEAQENLKQISDTVDKNLKSFNEFCDNSKKEVENSTKEINETENDIIKTEAEANKRAKELEEERQKLIEEFNKASEKSKEEIEEKQSSNDRIKEGTEMYVKSICDGVSKENSLQENLESLKKDNIDEKIEMTKAEFSKDQEIPNFEDYKNRINEIDQHLAGLEKIKENLRQQEQQNQEIDKPEPRDVQQLEPEENKEDLRVKIFNALNNSIRDGTGIAEKYENGEFRDKDDKKVDLQKVRDVKLLATTTKELNKAYKEGFLDQGDLLAEEEEARKAQEVVLNSGYFEANADLVKSINEVGEKEKNFFDTKKKIENIESDFNEDFEKKYSSINTDNTDPKKYDNLSKEDLENEKQKIEEEKQKLKDEYEKIQKEIKEAKEKIDNVNKTSDDINNYSEENNLRDEDVIKELGEKVKDLDKQLDIDFGVGKLESKRQEIEAKMAELAVNEKEIEIAQSQTVSTPQQDTTELNLDDEVKAIANTKENNKDELIENNVKLEDKCEQIYKQKGVENDKEKQYDVKCEELQKSINKLSDYQKKQYSERMEELIGYSLDMGVNKEKREKIDIDLCEKQRLYIKNNTSNVKDAGVGVKVADLSENYLKTVGQKSIGLVAKVKNIDPEEFYKDGEIPKDKVKNFNFTQFEVQSIAEDGKNEYEGYKIDLKLPKNQNTVDIMAGIREFGFEEAMKKYKDAGLEVNIRDKDGNLLSKDKQKEFFEKLQPKSAEESIGLEERKQKMNNKSLSEKEREKVRKEFEEIMKRVEKRIQKEESEIAKTTENLPTEKKNEKEEDSFPEMPNNMSKTLPHGSNFRVPKSENNNPNQQNGEQNMPENKKSNVRQGITEAMQNEYSGLKETQANNPDSNTPLPTSQNISAGQVQNISQGQSTP